MTRLLAILFLTVALHGVALAEPPVTTVNELSIVVDERDRQYQQLFEAQEKAVKEALTSAKEAVLTAQTAMEKRFDSVNEFRATLKDQQNTLLPRAEADARFRALDERFQRIEDRLAELLNRQLQVAGQSEGANTLWVIIAGVAFLAIAALTLAVNYRNKAPVK